MSYILAMEENTRWPPQNIKKLQPYANCHLGVGLLFDLSHLDFLTYQQFDYTFGKNIKFSFQQCIIHDYIMTTIIS